MPLSTNEKGRIWQTKHLGTWRAYARSKKRTAAQLSPILWRVTGGENSHYVKRMGVNSFECDCRNFETAKDSTCVHVMAVYRLMGLTLEKNGNHNG